MGQTAEHSQSLSVAQVIEETRNSIEGKRVEIGKLISGLGRLSHSALLLVPALVVATPLSGIPGLSSVGGIIIALVSLQALAGRSELWFPRWLKRLTLPADRLRGALCKLDGPAAWIDRHTDQRVSFVFHRPGPWLLYGLCFVCGASMPFLELVPFTSSILAGAVIFFAVAIVAHDGLLALIGMALVAGAIATGISLAG